VLGFTHILPKGLDHILFVLGLFLLSTRKGPLLAQVTAFTIAHTLTLGLSVFGVVSLSWSVVEPLIAASIAYVAVENILTPNLKPWRTTVVFGFGLPHGLGFAGVLQEVGLPRSQRLPLLASFNVGVELGQLTVIALAFLAVGGRCLGTRPALVPPARRDSRVHGPGVSTNAVQGRPGGVLRDAEQGEDLALKIRQLDVEDLHGLAVIEQGMPLDEAEEPEDLFRRRPLAAPLFGAEG
jgi:hypothetical protein